MREEKTTITYAYIVEESDLTEEILRAAEDVHDAYFADDKRVDWEDLWDRLDGYRLDDNTRLDLPDQLDSPVFTALKKHLKQHRRETR